MRIRTAHEDDAEAIANAEYETAAVQEGLLVSRPHEIPVQAFRDKINQLSDDNGELYIVLDDDGELKGHLILEPLGLQAVRHVVGLTIVIHPGHTGHGLGRKLMEYAIEWARQSSHVEKIELRVRSTNARARNLYESLGFRVEGILEDRIKLSDSYVDDVLMAMFVRAAQPHTASDAAKRRT